MPRFNQCDTKLLREVFLMKKPFVPPNELTVLNKAADGTMYQDCKVGIKSQDEISSGNQ